LIITLVPFSEKVKGHIGMYYLGSWPFEGGGTPKTPAYQNPSGFIEVTRENADTPVSAHFRLRDFLTKDQPNIWPKYLLLNPKLLDKLELTEQDMCWSALTLREVGNISSPFVLHVLNRAVTQGAPGGLWWMSSFGAGFSCHGALLEVE